MHLRFSQELKPLLERLATQPLTLGEILTETHENSFAIVMGLLTIPFLLPMPPGFTTILGSGCMLLSLQMILGRRSPWLPKKVGQVKFPSGITAKLFQTLQWLTKLMERFVRPRMQWFTDQPIIWRINGLCLAWLTFLLMLPIPFTNPIPTTGILLLVIAILEADGVLMCFSYGLTLAISSAVFGIGYLLWKSPELIKQMPDFLQLFG
jgi:hypothetical protein